jgi:hypothetical protein
VTNCFFKKKLCLIFYSSDNIFAPKDHPYCVYKSQPYCRGANLLSVANLLDVGVRLGARSRRVCSYGYFMKKAKYRYKYDITLWLGGHARETHVYIKRKSHKRATMYPGFEFMNQFSDYK